jgi:hypothetical protein
VKVLFIILIFLASCSPQNRLNRKVKRIENFAYKHGLVIQDTIKILDTVYVQNYNVDTLNTIIKMDSVTVINNEKIYLRYYYDTLRQEIYHEIECKGDTIIREILVPVDKIKVIDKDNSYIIVICILLSLILLLFLKKYYEKTN